MLSNLAARDVETLIHPYTNLATFRETGGLVLERGHGVWVYDSEGRPYLEGMAGLWCTALGAGTLGGYLLHGFVVRGVLYAGGFEPDWMHGPLGALVVTVVAAAGVTLLCTPAVLRVFRWVMEPRMDWAFRPVAPRTAGESGGTDGRAAVSGQAGTAETAGAETSEKAGAATGR